MSRAWKLPLCAAAMAASLMLVAAGCDSNKPGNGGEPTAPAPAGTNIPGAGAPGTAPGGAPGGNIPGGG